MSRTRKVGNCTTNQSSDMKSTWFHWQSVFQSITSVLEVTAIKVATAMSGLGADSGMELTMDGNC